MKERLNDLDAVAEIRDIEEDRVLLVAVESRMSYNDTAMLQPTGNFRFPEDVLDLIQTEIGWKASDLKYRNSGDYSGMFTFRISREQ